MNPFKVGDQVEVRYGSVGNYTWKPGVVTRIGKRHQHQFLEDRNIVWVLQPTHKHPYGFHYAMVRKAES